MDLKSIVRDLNASVQRIDEEENKDTIITNLQILSATEDLSVFDANSLENSELYVSLYELLTNHSTDPELVWCVVRVLSVAVQNPTARTALVHTYHFIHPLTALLDCQLTRERKSNILNIIQELSFGVVISWQEAHLFKLFAMLVDMIMDEDDQLTPLALGVLVNLLHNNKPAVYTLMDCVDVKKLIRKVVNLQRDNVETSVQVCKLLMVLDHLSGNVPDAEILTFVQISFIRIKKAFASGNSFLMRHIVHFFRDAKSSRHGRKVLLTYPKYPDEMNKLMAALESESESEVGDDRQQCVQQLLEFLQELVDLELVPLAPLFPRLAQGSLRWLRRDGVAPTVLRLLSVLLRQSCNKNEQQYKNVCGCLEPQLQTLIEMLHEGCRTGTSKPPVRELLVGLLQLFHELNENSNFCSIIATQVDQELVKNLLCPLVSLNMDDESQLFHHPLTLLCVEVLIFMSELSLDNKEWLFLYTELLQKKQILKILAIALYSGSYEVKKKILYLAGTTSFSSECLTGVSKYLTDFNKLFSVSPPVSREGSHDKNLSSPKAQVDFAPRFSQTQSESLNRLIQKLEDLLAKNQIQDASLAGIIELYNYKLGEMRRAERSLQSSLEAADRHRCQLSHRVAQMSAETCRLHQLLYASQQTVESCHSETSVLRDQLRNAQDSATAEHVRFKQLKQDVSSKSMIIKEQSEEISKMKLVIAEHEKQHELLEQKTTELEEKIENLKQNIKLLETEKSELHATNTKLQEKLKGRDEMIQEKEMLLGKKTTQVQTLEQEISKQLGLIKGMERSIKEKEKELQDLERTRKLIFEISGGKKGSA